VVEVNPRVSLLLRARVEATGYPIARVTAKVALGKRLPEIDNGSPARPLPPSSPPSTT